jgi:DNA helicase IV
VVYYIWLKLENRKERAWEQENSRKILYDFLNSRINEIKAVNLEYATYLKNDNGYFSNYQLTAWKEKYNPLFTEINGKTFEDIGLDDDEIATVREFVQCNERLSSVRAEYNNQFIVHEQALYEDFFKKIEKHGLDSEQQIAVITNEDNNIVIAGAGSGKTTTIVGKVRYIIERYKIPPSEILLISFTNKSAQTLAQRMNIEGIDVKTFHKFGKDVICEVEGKQPSIFDELQFKFLLTKFFEELIQNREYLHDVTEFFTDFLKPEKAQDDFKDQGEYFQYLKDQDYTTYKTKDIPVNGRTTLKREIVKSIEECKIANFLFFNGVNYKYELPYVNETATLEHRQYKPDFTIIHESGNIYLEHFAINETGEVPHFFADAEKGQSIQEATKAYNDGIEWKKKQHATHGTPLIETYSYEMFDGTLFEHLENRLLEVGIRLNPMTAEAVWKIIFEVAKDEYDDFIQLVQTFITLMKSNNYKIIDIIERNGKVLGKFNRKRNALFIKIIEPIFDKYQMYLSDRKEIDFSDMINKATSYVANKQFGKKYSYIIIDEFQDISIGRYQLVKAIKDNNPFCKLFCVGDDWQSIYRFSGSDISLFTKFDNYFGHAEKLKIQTTYRFHDPMIKLSSDFIQKNPNQEKKQLKGVGEFKSTKQKIVYSFSDDQDDTIALQKIFDEILSTGRSDSKEIYVLGRYSFDIKRIKNNSHIFQIDKSNGFINYTQSGGTGRKIKSQFMTVHKAKGLEADIVIVLNCNSGKHGFPSEFSDDAVLNLLLSEADQFENGEERRLFYVAMTRAKEMVYFVADSVNKSKFISELEIENGESNIKKCPKCKTADLVRRSGVKNGKPWAFDGCTNFMYGCSYKKWV